MGRMIFGSSNDIEEIKKYMELFESMDMIKSDVPRSTALFDAFGLNPPKEALEHKDWKENMPWVK